MSASGPAIERPVRQARAAAPGTESAQPGGVSLSPFARLKTTMQMLCGGHQKPSAPR